MSGPIAPSLAGMAGMSAAEKARVIYTQARSELSDSLWRAALGEDGNASASETGRSGRPRSLDALLGMLGREGSGASAASGWPGDALADLVRRQDGDAGNGSPQCGSGDGGGQGDRPAQDGGDVSTPAVGDDSALAMNGGPNARYAPMLRAAAARTGIPAAALATIVHAEAAKGSDGRWLAYSRNPRSSAAGLGQFLSGSWISEAERAGTWLNARAKGQGWLDEDGEVRRSARGEVLAMRYDAEAAIEATADYARQNIGALRRGGVSIGGDVDALAKAAYLGHHLGQGDAIRFLSGGLSPERARKLLSAQIGTAVANRRIADAGGAVAAHRSWLMGYVDRTIRPGAFSA